MMSHHGDEIREQSELLKMFQQQKEGKRQREWPNGRLAAEDDGAIAVKVGSDPEKGLVVIDFGTPVAWTAMGPQQAIDIAQSLIKNARAVAKEPVRVVLG